MERSHHILFFVVGEAGAWYIWRRMQEIPVVSGFTSGELTPWLACRFDLQAYQRGAAEITNFRIQPYGGIQFRPGTAYLSTLASDAVRLFPFHYAENDALMLEKIQSSLVNTIPLWKSQMVLAMGMEHSRQATAAQNAVTNMTNQLLTKNADMLKMGTIETAKEAERSVVDMETLQHTNQQLISTLDEVMKIQTEGAQKRREAELELGRIEGELKQKLLELRG